MVDAQGRIYAGTTLGIQVFDPTGRLCGVLALPAEGEPEHLGWEGESKDRLVVWIGDKKYARDEGDRQALSGRWCRAPSEPDA